MKRTRSRPQKAVGEYDNDNEKHNETNPYYLIPDYFCKHCAEYDQEYRLGERIYLPIWNKNTRKWNPVPLPPDHKKYLQCHKCGTVYHKNRLRKSFGPLWKVKIVKLTQKMNDIEV